CSVVFEARCLLTRVFQRNLSLPYFHGLNYLLAPRAPVILCLMCPFAICTFQFLASAVLCFMFLCTFSTLYFVFAYIGFMSVSLTFKALFNSALWIVSLGRENASLYDIYVVDALV